MPVLDTATVAARARALWPVLADTDAYPDARFEAWQDWAEAKCGHRMRARRVEGVAHLVAHAVIRSSDGAAAPGEVTALRTLSLSASFAASGVTGSDAELRTTRPGQAWLALRDSTAAVVMPRVVEGW